MATAPSTVEARRLDVWQAMSDCFLDTEVRPGLALVAATLVQSGYSDAELEEIWVHEVTPYCVHNLLMVAGEWGYFEIDPVRMMRSVNSQTRFSRFVHRLQARLVDDCWRGLRPLMGFLRTLPSEHVRAYARVLHAVATAYFDTADGALRARPPEPDVDVSRVEVIVRGDLAVGYEALLTREERWMSGAERLQRALSLLGVP